MRFVHNPWKTPNTVSNHTLSIKQAEHIHQKVLGFLV